MINLNLEDDGSMNSEAFTFAQFLKRLTYSDISGCASSKEETEHMIAIIYKLQSQLEKQGIAPR